MSTTDGISRTGKTYFLLALSAALGLSSGVLYQSCQEKKSPEYLQATSSVEQNAEEENSVPLVFKAHHSLEHEDNNSKPNLPFSDEIPSNYLHELLLKTGLGLTVNGDFFVLDEKSLKTAGGQANLDDKVVQFYIQTNKYRYLSYALDAALGSIVLDSIMKVESDGNFDPKNPCNKQGYCGLMQLGESAFVEVLRLSLSSEGFSRRFTENHPEVKPYFELLDRESGGLISLIQKSQAEIAEEKSRTNDAISQLKDKINEKKWDKNDSEYLRLQDWLKDEVKYNNSLTAFRRFLNSAVQINSMKRFNEANEIYQKMRGYEGDFIFDYGLFLKLSFVDENGAKNDPSMERDYTEELSLKNINDRLNLLWEKVKVDPKFNVTIAGIYWLYLKDVYRQNQMKSPEIYTGLDPFRVQLEYYNKGPSYVDQYLKKNGQLPGTGNYPKKVQRALNLFQDVNEQFYGSAVLECNHLNGANYCKNIRFPVIDQYLMTNKK